MYCKACYPLIPTCAKKDCKWKVLFDASICFRFCQHHKCKTPACQEACDNGVCDVCVVKSQTIGVCSGCGGNKSPQNFHDQCLRCQNNEKVCKGCEGPTGTYKDAKGLIQKYEYCVKCC